MADVRDQRARSAEVVGNHIEREKRVPAFDGGRSDIVGSAPILHPEPLKRNHYVCPFDIYKRPDRISATLCQSPCDEQEANGRKGEDKSIVVNSGARDERCQPRFLWLALAGGMPAGVITEILWRISCRVDD